MKQMIVVLYVMISIVLIVGTWVTVTLKRETNRLEPKAKKYEEICGGVKAALRTDRTLLHDLDDPPRLTPQQLEMERVLLYRSVGSERGGDDSIVMLDRCMPQPFPMDAWRGCIATNDDVCLRSLLTQAMDSIP